MLETIKEFKSRALEVRDYCKMIVTLEKIIDSKGHPSERLRVSDDLFKTLKAGAYLVIYNLVESTMRNAIQAIYDELRTEGVSYADARDELKRVALRNLKNINLSDKDAHLRMGDISTNILTIGFRADQLFSGNVDAKAIRDKAEEYGFSSTTDPKRTHNGAPLLTIKTNRNDLAHGVKAFTEVGRGVSAVNLFRDQQRIARYLLDILVHVRNYLDTQEYRRL